MLLQKPHLTVTAACSCDFPVLIINNSGGNTSRGDCRHLAGCGDGVDVGVCALLVHAGRRHAVTACFMHFQSQHVNWAAVS